MITKALLVELSSSGNLYESPKRVPKPNFEKERERERLTHLLLLSTPWLRVYGERRCIEEEKNEVSKEKKRNEKRDR